MRWANEVGAHLQHVAEDGDGVSKNGAHAFELCGKRLWVSADGAGARLLVRAGGGSLDLEAWLRRNRFWERARLGAGGARDARRGTDRG